MEKDKLKVLIIGSTGAGADSYAQALQALRKVVEINTVTLKDFNKSVAVKEFNQAVAATNRGSEGIEVSLKLPELLWPQHCQLQEEPRKPYSRFLNKPIGQQRRQKRI
jgi:hypothetical protein